MIRIDEIWLATEPRDMRAGPDTALAQVVKVNDHCACGCKLQWIGEEISEKLYYTPGVFHVECHIRGKWVCDQCETLTQAPMPAQIIEKGIPTAGLLAQVLIAKYDDHLPLYRRRRSSPAPVSRFRAPPWPSGSASAAYGSNR
ncbi:zinc-finger binding domain of transposase IS66 [Halomonas korlensis]|uniref:Zinc-finger binding domain of transposase IS66 n=1 Tax=Halomonas korlensis TaxID=463301 RepID=A0A1I7J9F7_9GAMM|nr:zinc-finger binding domain of transposase IS66 [Halomonas korlensis]